MTIPMTEIDGLLSVEGRTLILQAVSDGFILIHDVPRVLNERAADTTQRQASIKTLVQFLQAHKVATRVAAPNGASKAKLNGTVHVPKKLGRPKKFEDTVPSDPIPNGHIVVHRETPDPTHDYDPPPKENGRVARDPDATIKIYLNEIGKHKLLTPEEEVALARRIKKGDKAARTEMIEKNLRLVVKIAHDYEGLGLPLLDLINEGNIGLMKAVERFNPDFGAKLSTYGSWWIKQSIKRALANQSKTIRLPVHLVDKISHMRKVITRLHEVFGREPTDEEVGEEIGITASRVAQLRTAAIRPASLDQPIGEEPEHTYAEIIGDENAPTPYETLEEKTVFAMIRKYVKLLPERDRKILVLRFGLNGNPEKTLEQVGEIFGVTRERIRQLQNNALEELKKMIEKEEQILSKKDVHLNNVFGK